MKITSLPSIWHGDFSSHADFEARAESLREAFRVFDWIDDRLLQSRHPFVFPGYCAFCESVTTIRLDWCFAGSDGGASIHPAWTETLNCVQCELNSRMRALIDFVRQRCSQDAIRRVYVAELTTPSFRALSALFPSIIGSEYLGPNCAPGEIVTDWPSRRQFRHEDLTNLSFPSNALYLVITQDVFEHVPGYRQAFAEIKRVLSANGMLVFTIPFSFNAPDTRIRASLSEQGVIHHLPPEIHGNPVLKEGSLCFQNFGWDILDDLRVAGFAKATASLYWGPWQGHLGYPFFVFSAHA